MKRLRLRPHWMLVIILVCLTALWQIAGQSHLINPFILAYPSQIVSAIFSMIYGGNFITPSALGSAVIVTLIEILSAFGLAVCVGLGLGFGFGTSRSFGNIFEPFLLALFAFPVIILYPVIVLTMGIGVTAKVSLGLLVSFPYVVFNVSAGIRQIDPNLIFLSRSFGYSKLKTFFRVMIPSAIPTIFTGFRLGFAHAYLGVVVAQILLQNEGLGALLENSAEFFYIPSLYGVLVIILAIGVIGDSIFRVTESRLWQWRTSI